MQSELHLHFTVSQKQYKPKIMWFASKFRHMWHCGYETYEQSSNLVRDIHAFKTIILFNELSFWFENNFDAKYNIIMEDLAFDFDMIIWLKYLKLAIIVIFIPKSLQKFQIRQFIKKIVFFSELTKKNKKEKKENVNELVVNHNQQSKWKLKFKCNLIESDINQNKRYAKLKNLKPKNAFNSKQYKHWKWWQCE